MKEKWMPHIIAVAVFAVFIVLGLACATSPKVSGPVTFVDNVAVPDLSQAELFTKVKGYFDETFSKEYRNSNIWNSNQDSGIIRGKLVVDNVQHQDYLSRYNSTFTVEVKDGNYVISFTEPTIQGTGFISAEAREKTIQSYLAGANISAAAGLSNRTDEERRASWEKSVDSGYGSKTNPTDESPVKYDYQAVNFNEQWQKLAAELKRYVMVN